MNTGIVGSLHLHPRLPGAPMQAVAQIQLEAEKGVVEDTRYYARTSRATRKPSRRQVSLIGREQLAEHAAVLGLKTIAPGDARANVETIGVDLVGLVGKRVQVGEAVLLFYEPRTPCEKMDRICEGLRKLMENGRQGVMAQVVRSGTVRVGAAIQELD